MTDDDANNRPAASEAGAWAVGLATVVETTRQVLDTWYPHPRLGRRTVPPQLAAQDVGTVELDPVAAGEVLGFSHRHMEGPDTERGTTVMPVLTVIDDLADPPLDTSDAYLRLHLLSHRLVRPHRANLDGIFALLPNVVWTTLGPCPVDGFEDVRLRARAAGRPLQVWGVDKFPRMTDYVVPSGVRIADADRVRLGAHLGEGTTVMHEGFVNFNAGTLGPAMVEGRISAGVVVGEESDIGGGASIMGTLSGGGKEVVSVGKRCLLGANAGIGISLGDDCVVEAGLYVTGGTRVTAPDATVAKAAEHSGRSGLLFRRNSVSGAVEVLARSGSWGALNADLHAHN